MTKRRPSINLVLRMSPMRIARMLATVSFVLASAASAQEQTAAWRHDALLEPLPIRDQFLLGNGFFFFEPEGARVLDDGVWVAGVHVADANTFAKSGWITRSFASEEPNQRGDGVTTLELPRYSNRDAVFLVDGQTHRTTLTLRRGLGAHAEIGIALPITSIGGGWSDSTIEAVHRELRIGTDERDALRRNEETVYVRTPGQTYVRQRGDGYALGDVALTGKYELTAFEDRKLAVAVTGAVELPTGHAATLDGSGSLDAGAQLIISRDTPVGRLNASVGLLRLGANSALGLRPQLLITDTVGLARTITGATSAIAQLTVSESPFRQYNFPEFKRRSYQLSAGVQHAFRGVVLHAAFVENLVTYENSADAAISWGLSKRF
jgi:hypothetical protein